MLCTICRAYFELFAEYAAKRARELQEQADHSSSSSSHNKMLVRHINCYFDDHVAVITITGTLYLSPSQ